MTNVVYRLLVTDCASSGPTSIAEWKAYLSPITALAMDGTRASASSVSGSNSASAAFDGDPATYWESANHPTDSAPEWISCGLDPAFSYPWVTWFSIQAGADFSEAPTKFTLQVISAADPAANWKTVNGPISTGPWTYAGQIKNFCGAITPCTPMPLPTPPPPPPGSPATAATLTVWSSFVNTDSAPATARILLLGVGGGATNVVTTATPYALRSDSLALDSSYIPVMNSSGDIVVSCYMDCTGSPVTGLPASILVYDAYLDVTYADSTSARLRAALTDMDYSGSDPTSDPGFGAVTNASLAIDSDANPPTTYATLTRDSWDALDFFNAFELRFTFPN